MSFDGLPNEEILEDLEKTAFELLEESQGITNLIIEKEQTEKKKLKENILMEEKEPNSSSFSVPSVVKMIPFQSQKIESLVQKHPLPSSPAITKKIDASSARELDFPGSSPQRIERREPNAAPAEVITLGSKSISIEQAAIITAENRLSLSPSISISPPLSPSISPSVSPSRSNNVNLNDITPLPNVTASSRRIQRESRVLKESLVPNSSTWANPLEASKKGISPSDEMKHMYQKLEAPLNPQTSIERLNPSLINEDNSQYSPSLKKPSGRSYSAELPKENVTTMQFPTAPHPIYPHRPILSQRNQYSKDPATIGAYPPPLMNNISLPSVSSYPALRVDTHSYNKEAYLNGVKEISQSPAMLTSDPPIYSSLSFTPSYNLPKLILDERSQLSNEIQKKLKSRQLKRNSEAKSIGEITNDVLVTNPYTLPLIETSQDTIESLIATTTNLVERANAGLETQKSRNRVEEQLSDVYAKRLVRQSKNQLEHINVNYFKTLATLGTAENVATTGAVEIKARHNSPLAPLHQTLRDNWTELTPLRGNPLDESRNIHLNSINTTALKEGAIKSERGDIDRDGVRILASKSVSNRPSASGTFQDSALQQITSPAARSSPKQTKRSPTKHVYSPSSPVIQTVDFHSSPKLMREKIMLESGRSFHPQVAPKLHESKEDEIEGEHDTQEHLRSEKYDRENLEGLGSPRDMMLVLIEQQMQQSIISQQQLLIQQQLFSMHQSMLQELQGATSCQSTLYMTKNNSTTELKSNSISPKKQTITKQLDYQFDLDIKRPPSSKQRVEIGVDRSVSPIGESRKVHSSSSPIAFSPIKQAKSLPKSRTTMQDYTSSMSIRESYARTREFCKQLNIKFPISLEDSPSADSLLLDEESYKKALAKITHPSNEDLNEKEIDARTQYLLGTHRVKKKEKQSVLKPTTLNSLTNFSRPLSGPPDQVKPSYSTKLQPRNVR